MTNISEQKWVSCPAPAVSDTIRWQEPLWAKPNKPRGKPDKIGEQMVTARLLSWGEPAELEVIEVKRLSLITGAVDEPSKMMAGDKIRRKLESIKRGSCQKLVQSV